MAGFQITDRVVLDEIARQYNIAVEDGSYSRKWADVYGLIYDALSVDLVVDVDHFRRLHGSESSLLDIVDMANMGALRWDGHLVQVVAVLWFIRTDPGGFWRGEPAFPDTLAFTASQLPRSVRGTVVRNPYAAAPA